MNLSRLPRDENPPPFNEWILGQVQIAANKIGGVLKIDSDRRGCYILQNGKPVFVWIAGEPPLFAVNKEMMTLDEYCETLQSMFDAATEFLKGFLDDGDVSDNT